MRAMYKKTRSINILRLNFHGRRDKRLWQRPCFVRGGPIHAKSAICQLYLKTGRKNKIKMLFGTIKCIYFLNGKTTSTFFFPNGNCNHILSRKPYLKAIEEWRVCF